MNKILVTGGKGYLGGRIVSYLSNIGHQVSCGSRNKLLATESGLIQTDFEDVDSLTQSFTGFNAIVHLAGMNEIESAKNPELALHTTAIYTLRALQAAKKAGVSKFLYFSTVHVYGAPLSGLLTEISATRPIHPYSITHRAAEDFVYQAHREGSIDGIIFRLSNGYGYPASPTIDRWTLLVNELCRQVAITGKISLKSSGIQYRDFIPLDDICKAVALFASLPRQEDPFFNLGSGQSFTVRDVAHLIAQRYEKIAGKQAIISIPEPKLNEQPISFTLSVDKLNKTGLTTRSLVSEEIDEFISRCMKWKQEGYFSDVVF